MCGRWRTARRHSTPAWFLVASFTVLTNSLSIITRSTTPPPALSLYSSINGGKQEEEEEEEEEEGIGRVSNGENQRLDFIGLARHEWEQK
uniref:DUF834 domain-containing protein n=1 Tax=Oryza brachyantha TaxID=4533 RepID=J3N2P2_ORYBR